MSRPVKRSLTLSGHRTSVSLEPEFWEALRRLAAAEGVSINRLAGAVDADRTARDPDISLASALRVRLLAEARRGRC